MFCVLSRTMSAYLCFKSRSFVFNISSRKRKYAETGWFFQSRPFYENIMGNYRIPQQKNIQTECSGKCFLLVY